MSYKMRLANSSDCAEIVSLIQELADFENFHTGPKLCVEDLVRDGFGKCPAFYCFLAEHIAEAHEDKKSPIVGYAFFYNTYDTHRGKSYYLEDLCVSQSYRKKGVGSALWNAVTQEILKNNYCKLQFTVLNWNSNAISFYKHKGAEDKTLSDGRTWYRITRENMEKTVDINRSNPLTIPCKIRWATSKDCNDILLMIKELAIHTSNLATKTYDITLTENDLEKDGFGENPAFYVLLAEYYNETSKEQMPQIVGQAIYYHTYSTWYGKAACLEDFYVKENYRGKGIGTALWNRLMQELFESKCCRLDFSIVIPNTALPFFVKKDAKDMTKSEGWHFFRVSRNNIEKHQAGKHLKD